MLPRTRLLLWVARALAPITVMLFSVPNPPVPAPRNVLLVPLVLADPALWPTKVSLVPDVTDPPAKSPKCVLLPAPETPTTRLPPMLKLPVAFMFAAEKFALPSRLTMVLAALVSVAALTAAIPLATLLAD